MDCRVLLMVIVILVAGCGGSKAPTGTEHDSRIVAYLETSEADLASPPSSRVFCALESYGEASTGRASVDVYGWYQCNEWQPSGAGLSSGSGESIPAVFHLVQGDGSWVVEDRDEPRDGGRYTDDLERLFPEDLLDDVTAEGTSDYNERACSLERQTLEKARSHFDLPDADVVDGDACFTDLADS